MRASRVSFTAENAAGATNWLAILLRLGDHRDRFGIGEKSAPALLARRKSEQEVAHMGSRRWRTSL